MDDKKKRRRGETRVDKDERRREHDRTGPGRVEKEMKQAIKGFSTRKMNAFLYFDRRAVRHFKGSEQLGTRP